MGTFRQILTELSARYTPIFSFLDVNLSKYQGILTKLGTCIDIKNIWFGFVDGKTKFRQFFDRVICPRHDIGRILSFYFLLMMLLHD